MTFLAFVGYWDEEKKTYVSNEYGANPNLAAKNDFHDLYDLESVAASARRNKPRSKEKSRVLRGNTAFEWFIPALARRRR